MKIKNVLLIIVVITMVGFGCKKLADNPQTTNADPTAAKIEQFLKTMESNNRSGSDMTITETIWNIEAALNYAYCDVSLPYIKRFTDTITFQIPVNNNMVNWNNVTGIYDYCLQKMNTYASTFDFTHHFVVIDLADKGVENGNMTIKLYVVVAQTDVKNSQGDERSLRYFDTTDYWLYGMGQYNNGGKCGSYSGQTDLDAALLIKGRINVSLRREAGTYFTAVYTAPDVDVDNYPICGDCNDDNYYDYLMFYNFTGWSNYHDCLQPYEMNFYLDGTNSVLYTYEANDGPRPAGKNPITIDLTGDLISGPDWTVILHRGDFTYGIEHHHK